MGKKCTECGEEKSTSEFYRQRASRDGLSKCCKICNNTRCAMYRKSNSEKVRARGALYRSQNPGRSRAYHLLRKFNLTPESWTSLLASQNNCCANQGCKATEPAGKYNQWHVDHDHSSGKVRGLLCTTCNIALGLLKDQPNRILGLANYLSRALHA